MDLVVIKQILRLAGITNLAVRFDVPNQQIIATFIKARLGQGDSQMRTTTIKFADIENMFTEGPSQATAGPPAGPTNKKGS